MPTAYLNRRWISKFLVEKIVSEKPSLIHSILHQTGTITSGFEGKKRKYHFLKIWTLLWYALSRAFSKKRKHSFRFLLGILLKSTENRKECFLKISSWLWYAFYKPSSNLENRMTVCMGYPAMTLTRRAGKTLLKGGRKAMQRERHSKFEITMIRKTGTNSSNFTLKFTSYFLITGTTSS